MAARVAATVVRMPPAAYGTSAIRAANSSPRSLANTRWVWLSTKPGKTQRPPRPWPGAKEPERFEQHVLDMARAFTARPPIYPNRQTQPLPR